MSDSPDSSLSTQAKGPLAGIRVLELGQLIAGPFASSMLAYFGADVIKVEPPGSGDAIRNWRLMDGDTSYWWYAIARNKKSVAINLRETEGRALAASLASHCDVLLENFRPGTLERWGLGPDDLRKTNPNLIYTRVSGYGQTGPYSAKPGFASACEAMGGLRYLNGFSGDAPVRPNLSLGDTLAAVHAVIGTLMALLHRERSESGDGQVVDVAIYESVFNMLESVLPEYDGAGVVREPSGTTLTGIVPTNTYRCVDGRYIVIGGNGDSIYKRLMDVTGRSDLGNDPRMANNQGRVTHQQVIDDAIGLWTSQQTADNALALLDGAGVPASKVYSAQDIAEDPHFAARGMIETVSANGRDLKIPGIPPKLSATPGATRWAGPRLGEHTETVLSDLLALDSDYLADLQHRGIVHLAPHVD